MDGERVIPTDILDDLCCRFIINVPEEERRDLNRIFFQIEYAHWFYIDFYSKNFPNRKLCVLREFAQQVFRHVPFLQPFCRNVNEIFEDWKDYKFCVPTFGAILLDEELSHILLVQNYRSSWGFPKGKVNKDEPPYQCAIREVYEETGFNISHMIDTNDYLEANVNKQIIRLYVVPGVKKCQKFVPKTRNEIKAVNWFPIADLPLNKKDAHLKQMKLGSGVNTFYMVSPFLKKIRHWIYEYNSKPRKPKIKQRHKSCSDIDNEHDRIGSFSLEESIQKLRICKESGSKMDEVNIHYSVDMLEDDNVPTKLVPNESDIRSNFDSDLAHANGKINRVEGHPSLPAIKRNLHLNSPKYDIIRRNSSNDALCASLHSSALSSLRMLSGGSAFTKVDISDKSKREGKHNEIHSKCDISNGKNTDKLNQMHGMSICGESQTENLLSFKPLDHIPGWDNFQFNLNSILKSMNEAVLSKSLKNNSIKR